MIFERLEGAPNHATLGACHATDEHAWVVLHMLRNKHAGLRSASGVRAGHGVGKARSARVAKLLDGAPRTEASVASFAFDAVGVVTGVLVKRNSVCKVRCTHDVATATAVGFAEVPCEVGLAEGACISRRVRLEDMLGFDHQGMVMQHARCMMYVLDGRLIGTPRFAPV